MRWQAHSGHRERTHIYVACVIARQPETSPLTWVFHRYLHSALPCEQRPAAREHWQLIGYLAGYG